MSINYIINTVLVQVYGTQDVTKICKVEVLKYGAPRMHIVFIIQ